MSRTREDIMRTALEVFREKGYERTTVRAIADRAGVPVSTLYTHIASKEELFLGLVTPAIEDAGKRMEAILASDRPALEKLRAALVGAATAFDEHYPELFIYLRDFYPALERGDAGARRRYERQWVEILAESIGSGELREELDAKMLTYGVLGMLNWMHQWYRPGGRYSAAEIGEQFATVIIRGLAAGPPG